jgi:hypothetical protein
MGRLIEFDLDATGQTKLLVESDDPTPVQGQMRVSVGGAVAEKASQAFDAVLAGVKPIAETLKRELTHLVTDANEISVEFGIKLTANAGVVLAGTSAEGNCKIAIKWTRRP